MTEVEYKMFIGGWIESNHNDLVRSSKMLVKKISNRTKDNAHELLSCFVLYLYEDANRNRICKIIQEGWLHKFATLWMQKNLFGGRNIYGKKIKYAHTLPDWNFQDAVADRSRDESDFILKEIILDAESAPLSSRDNLRDMYSAGMNEGQVDNIIRAYMAADDSLEPHEKILFQFYFVNGMSYRDLQRKLNIDKSQVFRMVKVIEEKIKNRIAEYD